MLRLLAVMLVSPRTMEPSSISAARFTFVLVAGKILPRVARICDDICTACAKSPVMCESAATKRFPKLCPSRSPAQTETETASTAGVHPLTAPPCSFECPPAAASACLPATGPTTLRHRLRSPPPKARAQCNAATGRVVREQPRPQERAQSEFHVCGLGAAT